MSRRRKPTILTFLRRLPDLPLARPRRTVVVVLLMTLVGLFGITRLREQEDILSFLPGQDPGVTLFRDVAARFGAMRVALIGVVPPDGQELFSADMLGRLDRLSSDLKNTEGVDRVVSLSTMTDLVVGPGGVEIRALVPSPPPTDAATIARLRERALSLGHVRGNIVSADGKAGLLLVFLTEGASTRRVVDRARDLALAQLQPAKVYFGGAPFAGQAIYNDTRVDTRRLTPIALLFFLVIVHSAFKDWLAVLLTVGTVAVAGIWVLGGMGLAKEPFTVVTAMLPVILFAAGSQYAIHILARYYILRATEDALPAARGSMRIAGPPVSIAASATGLGFLSFLVMNIQPMRSFGLACAFGILVSWALSMTLVPSVVAAWPRPAQAATQGGRLADWLERLWDGVQARRGVVLISALVLVVVVARFASQVVVRMEPRAFFRPGSEPALAQQFMDDRFGGSQFVQILVHGDPLQPAALREIQRLSAFARTLPGVTQVQALTDPLVMVSEAMGAGKALPGQRRQVGNLLFFLEGEPSVRTLLTADHGDALVHVRFRGESAPVIEGLEGYLSRRWPWRARAHTLDELSTQATWVLGATGDRDARLAAARAALVRIGQTQVPAQPTAAAVSEALQEVLRGEEAQDLSDAARQAMAGLLRAGHVLPDGTLSTGTTAWLAEHGAGLTEDQANALGGAAVERAGQRLRREALQRAADLLWRALQADRDGALLMPAREARDLVELVAAAALPGGAAEVPPAAGLGQMTEYALTYRLTGEPLLDRGFSRAVEQNQWASLSVAMVSVFAALLIALRSVQGALMCLLPAGLSLAVIFGALGFLRQPIDIGTSLVGSIVTGSGADFAMHYIWYLRRSAPRDVARVIGPVILTTAVLLSAGLGVLALGSSPPMRLFGVLAAMGLLLSALFTFLLVPALLRKVRKERRDFG